MPFLRFFISPGLADTRGTGCGVTFAPVVHSASVSSGSLQGGQTVILDGAFGVNKGITVDYITADNANHQLAATLISATQLSFVTPYSGFTSGSHDSTLMVNINNVQSNSLTFTQEAVSYTHLRAHET